MYQHESGGLEGIEPESHTGVAQKECLLTHQPPELPPGGASNHQQNVKHHRIRQPAKTPIGFSS